MKNDNFYMAKAFSLAEKGTGKTSPNPLVGAVIVKDDHIIGEGYHRGYGLPHAEAEAILNSVESVENATLYCTLEPCSFISTEKHTPPCTSLIIKERIRKVVVSSMDPNPLVNGNGIRTLREAGIEVVVGVMENRSEEINYPYFHWIKRGTPFVHLKIAQSLDGRIATKEGESRWITDINARKEVYRLRGKYDAVLVGLGTAIKDNPSLSVRNAKGTQPVRIILDSSLKIPRTLKIIKDDWRTIIFTSVHVSSGDVHKFKSVNVDIIQINENSDGLDLKEMLFILGKMNIASILVEGGAKVFTSFLYQRLWNKISVFTAPFLIGSGIEAVDDLKIRKLSQAVKLGDISIKRIGEQVLWEGNRIG